MARAASRLALLRQSASGGGGAAAAVVAAAPGDTAGAAILRMRRVHLNDAAVDAAPLDRDDVRTILIILADINVNIRVIREILEEERGEDSEDDA